ncbi:MAG: hypothetical protein LUE92_15020 [Clostridiales bacterium]|nr:hypothetical protein [Clostridiales bacterium]
MPQTMQSVLEKYISEIKRIYSYSRRIVRWYEGIIEPDDFSEDLLNETELKNLDTINNYMSNMGY